MAKGFAVTIMIAFVAFIFLLLLIVGISGNYSPAGTGIGDVIGGFFTALTKTFSQFIVVTNTLIFSALFFATEAVFIYVYYKLGMAVFHHIPQMQGWLRQAKGWFNR